LHFFLSPPKHFLPKELSQVFAPIPGGPHGTISNDHCSVNFARIIVTSGAAGTSARWLSFALLFGSIRAPFFQKNYLKFSLQFPARATCNSKAGAIYANGATLEIYDSAFIGNSAGAVSSSEAVFRNFPDFSAPIVGGPHEAS
jgi:hypothetical protein